MHIILIIFETGTRARKIISILFARLSFLKFVKNDSRVIGLLYLSSRRFATLGLRVVTGDVIPF